MGSTVLKKLKLLFVIDDLGSGGAQRQIVNLARGLKSRNHHVEVFTYYPENHFGSLLDDALIPIFFNQKLSRFSFAPLLALRKLINRCSFDIVLSFLRTPNLYTEIATIGIDKIKLVISERSMYLPGRLSIKLRILQECHRLADAITVNSHHQRIRMEREFPWMKKNILTIYNSVDLNVFIPDDVVKRKDDPLALLAISSVSFNKNSLNVAKAIYLCRNKYQLNVHINWIGTHHIAGESTRAMQETSDYLREMGLTEQWSWLGEQTDIPYMLLRHDALIHAAYFEGLPNVICEAMACGRPVLASNVCDHPLLVQDKVSGFLFNPDSPEDIASTINTFSMLGTLQRQEMGKAARMYAEKNLSLERFIDDYENLFFSLTAKQDDRI